MGNIGAGELLLLFFVFLLFFGAKKLPGMARSLGRTVEQFRRAASDVREEFLRADQEESSAPKYEPPAKPETYGYPPEGTDGNGVPAATTPAAPTEEAPASTDSAPALPAESAPVSETVTPAEPEKQPGGEVVP